jgi:hypothetical protein
MKEKSKLDDPLAQGLAGLAIKAPDAYWQGHDPKDDETLARKLFLGQVVQAKNGRRRHEYLTGHHERDAIAALSRLLSFTSRRPLNPVLLALLTCSLDSEDDSTERRLVFQLRKKKGKRKKRHDLTADYQVARYVAELGDPVESAVSDASTKFKITTKTVYAIIKRTKEALKQRP